MLAASFLLLFPANLFPRNVTTAAFGGRIAYTNFGYERELWHLGLWPLVDFGAFGTEAVAWGATAFIVMVLLVMLSARAFDPRLMWDAAGRAPLSGCSRGPR